MDTNQTLRDRLVQIEAQLVLLEAERQNIRRKLGSLRYPVLTLPFDIVSEIFVHSAPAFQDAEAITVSWSDERPTAVNLTQICRTWRHVALNTPKLWASFRIITDDWIQNHNRCSHRLAEWLARVKLSPLSFILQPDTGYWTSRYQPSSAVFSPLLALSMQWREADLHIHAEDFVTDQFQLGLRGRVPSLETLSLQLRGDCEPKTMMTAFEHAPNLRAVTLRDLAPSAILLPWSQLTHFTGHHLPAADCLHVLQQAVSLVQCKFTSVESDIEDMTLLAPHPRLEVLQIDGYSACVDMLSILTLPSLLELDYDDDHGSNFYAEFVAFLSRARPPLQRLILRSTHQHVVHGASFLPWLVDLKITTLTDAQMLDLVQTLRTRDAVSFLPSLTSLVMTVCEHSDSPVAINYEHLRDALDVRWNRNKSGHRLSRFEMVWYRAHSPDWQDSDSDTKKLLSPPPDFRMNLEEFQNLVQEGMQISIVAEAGHFKQTWI
ncbi:hypothetical protein C8R46DRAFT_1192382 [Mycena filopes]|nr:hypothetical protein C8R46DRAFT_1192382 [Mycena filopes]